MSPEEAAALKNRHAEQESDRVKKRNPEEAAKAREYDRERNHRSAESKVAALERDARHENRSSTRPRVMAAEARLLPDSYFPGVNARITH